MYTKDQKDIIVKLLSMIFVMGFYPHLLIPVITFTRLFFSRLISLFKYKSLLISIYSTPNLVYKTTFYVFIIA